MNRRDFIKAAVAAWCVPGVPRLADPDRLPCCGGSAAKPNPTPPKGRYGWIFAYIPAIHTYACPTHGFKATMAKLRSLR